MQNELVLAFARWCGDLPGMPDQRDLEKLDAAVVLGWKVFRFSVEDTLQVAEIETLRSAVDWRVRFAPEGRNFRANPTPSEK